MQHRQHLRTLEVPALSVAKFISVRKSTKNIPISTASCSFFPRFPMPSELQHISLPDAARCITPRTAVHRPSQRYASAFAPHSTSGATLPPRLPMPSSTQSTRDLSRHQGTFRPISHRARNIYIMYRKQKHTFSKKKGHNALPICQIALPLQSQNGDKRCQARQNDPQSTLDA